MEYSKLYEMINYLQYGTKLHIGVIFLGNYGNDMVKLPHRQKIHAGALCEEFKTRNFKKCFRCRNSAIYKALKNKKDFGGVCVNGIYEYTRPIVINDDVAGIIFIGNILNEENGYRRLKQSIGDDDRLLDTLEKDFGEDKCIDVGRLLESYIRVLLENYAERSEGHPVIENIKSYIEDNLEFDIEISHIAKLFHYNEQYFGRFFKKKTGVSLSNYINSRRIKKAYRLLEDSDDTVLVVANKSGFNSVSYFNRVFKKAYGLTPSECRNNRKPNIYKTLPITEAEAAQDIL